MPSATTPTTQYTGRSPHGERGLKSSNCCDICIFNISRRSPHGERGLKSEKSEYVMNMVQSLPTRGAWIEIFSAPSASAPSNGRSPHGERGLKFLPRLCRRVTRGRSPHGERGLKLTDYNINNILSLSLPTRGAWIEMRRDLRRGGDRQESLPTRGAWIEITPVTPAYRTGRVAPHTGSVD